MSPTSYRAAPPRGDESHCNGGMLACQPPTPHSALSPEGRGIFGGLSQRGKGDSQLFLESSWRSNLGPSPCSSPQRGEGSLGSATRSGEGAPSATAHAVGLAGFVAAGAGEAPEDAPRPARGQQPVGLATEGAEELLLEALAAEIRGARKIGAEGLDEVLGHDAAHPDRQEERGRRRARRQIEEPRVPPA